MVAFSASGRYVLSCGSDLLRATGEAPRAVASTALATLSTLSPPRSCLWTDLSR
jgi:hypothetical protein